MEPRGVLKHMLLLPAGALCMCVCSGAAAAGLQACDPAPLAGFYSASVDQLLILTTTGGGLPAGHVPALQAAVGFFINQHQLVSDVLTTAGDGLPAGHVPAV